MLLVLLGGGEREREGRRKGGRGKEAQEESELGEEVDRGKLKMNETMKL